MCTSITPGNDVPCSSPSEPCKTWGLKEEGVDAVSLLNANIEKANGVCMGTLYGDDAISTVQELNMIVNTYANGDFDSDTSFLSNVDSAATQAASVLKGEDIRL